MKVGTKLLHPHPRNSEFFDDITGEPWREFLKSVETSGIIQPVVITQDNVVVSGHQRLRACQELGIVEIPVVQRTYADEDAVLKDLLETNIRQRGVDNSNPVKLGRCIKELERLYGIEHGGNRGNQYTEKVARVQNDLLPKTESDLAEQLKMSQSALKRYKKLAELIPELEDFVETGMITPHTALALSRQLAADDQRKLLESLDKETKYSAAKLQPYIDKIKHLEAAPPKVVPDEEAKRKLVEAERTIKSLRSAETSLRSRAEEAESSVSALTAERDDLLKEALDLDRQLGLSQEEVAKLRERLEGRDLDFFVANAETNFEDIQNLSDISSEVQQLLETKLAPIMFKKCLFNLDGKSGHRMLVEELVKRVKLWVEEMENTLSTEDAKVIDM